MGAGPASIAAFDDVHGGDRHAAESVPGGPSSHVVRLGVSRDP